MNWGKALLVGLTLTAASLSPAGAQDYTIRLVAGSPGYDHIQPFMAEHMKIWEKYGLKVAFSGGNYMRSNQQMAIGDFDVGYNQIASAIRYNSAGIPNVIVAPSSANCALIVASPKVNSWADLKGKRFGIVTKFDMQYMALTKHILPRFGLSEKDIQPAQVPVPEIAAGLLTGDVAAAFPFEPYGSNAIARGAKLMLAASDMIDQSKIKSDLLRNALILNRKFMAAHPELAKRIVWAHLDAIHIMRTDRDQGIKVIKHYNPNMDVKLIADSYDNCGWTYNEIPRVWIETTIGWMTEDKLIQNPVKYDDVVDMSMAASYPGYPGWEKIKK
jgi:ABC-type nitrate/sulfonate/bicarbonate transport system substrate-binding protein